VTGNDEPRYETQRAWTASEEPLAVKAVPYVDARESAASAPSGRLYSTLDRLLTWKTVAALVVLALIFAGVGVALLSYSDNSTGSATKKTSTNTSPTNATGSGGGSTGAETTSPGALTVSRIAGGDVLWLNKGTVKVRLVQVDAPDVATNDCYSNQAVSALQQLAPVGTTVTIKRDQQLASRDPFGRLLRYVFVSGQNINLELVRRGATSPYFFFGQRGRYAHVLLVDAKRARRAHRGLWGACPATKLDPNHEVQTRP
jgi:micrococcal nuclease